MRLPVKLAMAAAVLLVAAVLLWNARAAARIHPPHTVVLPR